MLEFIYINTTTLLYNYDDFQLPPFGKKRFLKFTTFSFMKKVPLPGKTTCTDFLLELNNIPKDNTTVEVMDVLIILISRHYSLPAQYSLQRGV